VRERVLVHSSRCLALDAIVPDGGRGVHSFFDVAWIEDVLALRLVRPNPGVAIRLKLEADR